MKAEPGVATQRHTSRRNKNLKQSIFFKKDTFFASLNPLLLFFFCPSKEEVSSHHSQVESGGVLRSRLKIRSSKQCVRCVVRVTRYRNLVPAPSSPSGTFLRFVLGGACRPSGKISTLFVLRGVRRLSLCDIGGHGLLC